MSGEPVSDKSRAVHPENDSSYFNPLTIGFAAIGLLVMIGLVVGVAALLTRVGPPTAARRPAQLTPPEPRLQVAPQLDFQQLKSTQMARLASYAWLDREAGVVRIPIERAMQIIVEEGYAVTPATLGPTATPGPSPTSDLVSQGRNLFQQLGCGSCHTGEEDAVGPPLEGLFGTQNTLQTGETVTVDEDYLRTSILDPSAQLVQGYQDVMPSFQDRLDEGQLNALVAYIRSLEAE